MIVLNSILNPAVTIILAEPRRGTCLCAAKYPPKDMCLLALTHMWFAGSEVLKESF